MLEAFLTIGHRLSKLYLRSAGSYYHCHFSSVPASLTILSPERQTLQRSVRQLCDTQIRPLSRQMDDQHRIMPSAIDSLFAMGLMGIEINEEYGGSGMEFVDTILAVEEISKADASVSALVDIHVSLLVVLNYLLISLLYKPRSTTAATGRDEFSPPAGGLRCLEF